MLLHTFIDWKESYGCNENEALLLYLGSRHASAAVMTDLTDRPNAWCRDAARGKKIKQHVHILLERMATQKNHNERTLK